ncbi:putative sodium/chloride dependent transporter [Ixodes scapularis]
MSSGSGGSGGSGEALQLGPPEKDYYATEKAFIFVCICIAVSYQSFADFPYLIIKHGGVCFFILYTIVLFLLGIPMAYLEMLLGQFRGRGCLEIWSCVPIGKGLGMAMLLKTFVICAYKVFQDSIAFYYFLQIFQQELPWSHCYTCHGVLKVTRSIDEFGGLRYEILVCYIFSWFVVYIVCAQGAATVGRLAPYLGVIPFVTLIIVTMNTLFYPHARSSLLELMFPRWDHVFTLSAWGDAVYSVLTGLAIGIGQLHAMASYNNFESRSLQWAVMVLPLFMTFSNVLGSLLVLGASGSLAHHLGQCVVDLGTYNFLFPFVVYPEMVKTAQWARLWSGIFYFTIFMISIDEMAGAYIFKLLQDNTVKAIMPHLIPLVEVCTISWLYGLRRFSFDVEFMLSYPPSIYFRLCWIAICPLMLFKPSLAFVPEYHWEPNTKDRVDAYFEELEEQGLKGDSVSEVRSTLYNATEALEVSVDPQAPLVFRPPI